MNNKSYKLTKSRINSGLQCKKKLWFDLHEKIKEKDDPRKIIGNNFNIIVRKNYGKGLDLSNNKDIPDVVNKTRKAINSDKTNVIYEGAFIHQDTLVRTDVLIRKKNGWELLEAKSSKSLKPEHIPDIAIQSFIVRACKVNLSKIKLIHINGEFSYKGNNNYDGLISENEITSKVILKEKDVLNYINDLKSLAEKNKPCPSIPMGNHCKNPYPCIYQDKCKEDGPKNNFTSYKILPWCPKDLKKYCEENKIIDLQKVPEKFLLNNRKGFAKHYYKIIQEAHKNNEPWINPNIKKVLKKFSFPFYFMDFEYVDQGVPIVENTKPYVKLPFQWSVHKWDSENSKIDNGKSFLGFDEHDIERQFIERLLEAVGDSGTVFAHNATSAEVTILEQLKKKDNCKDLAAEIDKLIKRIEDTLILVGENFYSPLMNGKYKIKNIIRAIPNCPINYEEKNNIAGGDDAQSAWFLCTNPKTDLKKIEDQKKFLKDYCSKDTLAVYYLIKYLMEESKKNEKKFNYKISESYS